MIVGFVTAIFHGWEAVDAQIFRQLLVHFADGAYLDGLEALVFINLQHLPSFHHRLK